MQNVWDILSLRKHFFVIQCAKILSNKRNNPPWQDKSAVQRVESVEQHIGLACLPPMGKQHFGKVKGGSAGLQDYSRLLKLKQHLDKRVSNFLNFRLTAPTQSYFKGWIQSWNLMGKSSLNNTMSDKQFWPNKISWCLKPFCNRLYSHDNKIIYDNNNIKK